MTTIPKDAISDIVTTFRDYQDNDEADYGWLLNLAEDMAELLEEVIGQ